MDSSKSLQTLLKMREKAQSEKILEIESLLSKSKASIENLDSYMKIRHSLQKDLELCQKKVSEYEKEKLVARASAQGILDLLETLEENLKYWEKATKKIHEQIRFYEEMRARLSDYESSFVGYFDDYVEKADLTRKAIQSFSEFLKGQAARINEISDQIQKNEAKVSERLDFEKKRMRDVMARLDEASRKTIDYEEQKKSFEQMSHLLSHDREKLDESKTIWNIQQRLEELIRNYWTRQSALFFSKIRDRVNQYFGQIGLDMSTIIDEDKISVAIKGEKLDLNSLSGGERTILDLLVRISFIKELNGSSVLFLDQPIVFLDQQGATKVLSFVGSLKKDFKQIVITTQREDFPIEADNKILLDTQEL